MGQVSRPTVPTMPGNSDAPATGRAAACETHRRAGLRSMGTGQTYDLLYPNPILRRSILQRAIPESAEQSPRHKFGHRMVAKMRNQILLLGANFFRNWGASLLGKLSSSMYEDRKSGHRCVICCGGHETRAALKKRCSAAYGDKRICGALRGLLVGNSEFLLSARNSPAFTSADLPVDARMPRKWRNLPTRVAA